MSSWGSVSHRHRTVRAINVARSGPEKLWFLELVARWRGDLHSDRLVDQVGQNWFRTIETHSLLPRDPAPLLPDGQPSATGSLQQFAHMIERQVSVMTTADIFLLMAALCGVYMFVTLVLPIRTILHASC